MRLNNSLRSNNNNKIIKKKKKIIATNSKNNFKFQNFLKNYRSAMNCARDDISHATESLKKKKNINPHQD